MNAVLVLCRFVQIGAAMLLFGSAAFDTFVAPAGLRGEGARRWRRLHGGAWVGRLVATPRREASAKHLDANIRRPAKHAFRRLRFVPRCGSGRADKGVRPEPRERSGPLPAWASPATLGSGHPGGWDGACLWFSVSDP